MGYSISWCAVSCSDPGDLLVELGMRLTKRTDEFFESDYSGGQLKTGWWVFVESHDDLLFTEEDLLARLSRRWPVLAAFVEENTMFSSAAFWEGGARRWEVQHDPNEGGLLHLETSGTLPGAYEQLRQRQFAKQQEAGGEDADVDYVFDVPLLLARELTGFKHDKCKEEDFSRPPVVVKKTLWNRFSTWRQRRW